MKKYIHLISLIFTIIVIPSCSDYLERDISTAIDEEPYKGTDSGPAFRKGGYMSQEYPLYQ